MESNFRRKRLSVYGRRALLGDLPAALGLAAIALPQALAIAFMMGIPPELVVIGLTGPAVLYAWMGASSVVSLGPVYLIGLMTLQIASGYAAPGTAEFAAVTAALALESALCFGVLRALRIADSANILSHTVIGGVINGAALIIIIGHLPALLGFGDGGAIAGSLVEAWQRFDGARVEPTALAFAAASFGLLLLLGPAAGRQRLRRQWMPIVVVAVGAALVGKDVISFEHIESSTAHGWPWPALTSLGWEVWLSLLPASALISAASYFQTRAVVSDLAGRGQRSQHGGVRAEREFEALGAANAMAGLLGSMPLAASPSRTRAALSMGSRSLLAPVVLALVAVIVIVLLVRTDWALPTLPFGVIAVWYATQLFNFTDVRRVWRFNRVDAMTHLVTMVVVVVFGVAVGLMVGLVAALAAYVQRSSRPAVVEVGLLADRNICRALVRNTDARRARGVCALRVDGNIYFANARYIEELIETLARGRPDMKHLVLGCQAVNSIDVSGLMMLERVVRVLRAAGVELHLADVKGNLERQLRQSRLIRISGQRYGSTFEALTDLEQPA